MAAYNGTLIEIRGNYMLIALVGISGVGKSYLKKQILRLHNELESLIAVTTRNPRVNEIDGQDKFFLTESQFDKKRDDLDIITEMYGFKYAFRKSDLKNENNKIAEIYYKDITKLKEEYNVVVIWIKTGKRIRRYKELYKRYGLSVEFFYRALKDMLINIFLCIHRKMFDYILNNSYDKVSVSKLNEYVNNILGGVR